MVITTNLGFLDCKLSSRYYGCHSQYQEFSLHATLFHDKNVKGVTHFAKFSLLLTSLQVHHLALKSFYGLKWDLSQHTVSLPEEKRLTYLDQVYNLQSLQSSPL
jgi:hypothetical protein